MRKLTIILFTILIIGGVYGETIISGEISQLTWTAQGSPYIITDSAYVNNDTLRLEPGTIVEFQPAGQIWINSGSFIAHGTEADSIYLTKNEESNQEWKGMVFLYGIIDKISLDYCVVSGTDIDEFYEFYFASSVDNLITSYLNSITILNSYFCNSYSNIYAFSNDPNALDSCKCIIKHNLFVNFEENRISIAKELMKAINNVQVDNNKFFGEAEYSNYSVLNIEVYRNLSFKNNTVKNASMELTSYSDDENNTNLKIEKNKFIFTNYMSTNSYLGNLFDFYLLPRNVKISNNFFHSSDKFLSIYYTLLVLGETGLVEINNNIIKSDNVFFNSWYLDGGTNKPTNIYNNVFIGSDSTNFFQANLDLTYESLFFKNNIFYNINDTFEEEEGYVLYDFQYNMLPYDCVFSGTGNLNGGDPMFADPENLDFSLLQGSPCINSGNPDPIFNDIDGSRNDMGIFGGPEPFDTSFIYTGIDSNPNNIPNTFELSCSPNPFNPKTQISFRLQEKAFINVSVYNINGELVKRLCSGNKDKGEHSILWNGLNQTGKTVSTGVYFVSVKSEQNSETVKALMMK